MQSLQDKNTKKELSIVALSCSPSRHRNSDTMLDHFLIGINKNLDHNQKIEKIYLQDIHIEKYKYENGSQPMNHEQDFYKLTQKIKYADGLIISTPTYNFSVPADLKNFIDRIRFMALDLKELNILNQPNGKLKNLNLFFLVSGGTPNFAKKFLFFLYPDFWLKIVFLYYGSKKMKSFYSGDKETFKNQRILNEIEKLGHNYFKKLNNKKYNNI